MINWIWNNQIWTSRNPWDRVLFIVRATQRSDSDLQAILGQDPSLNACKITSYIEGGTTKQSRDNIHYLSLFNLIINASFELCMALESEPWTSPTSKWVAAVVLPIIIAFSVQSACNSVGLDSQQWFDACRVRQFTIRTQGRYSELMLQQRMVTI